MKERPGTLRIGLIPGVPVFLHWTLPLGGLVASALIGFKFPQTYFVCLAYTSLIALHESAHASAALAFGVRVESISISAFGGSCRFHPPKSFIGALVISSAGIFAQAVVLVSTIGYTQKFGWPRSALGDAFATTFLLINSLLILLNLFPDKTRHSTFATDGYLIWRLIGNKLRGRAYAFPDTSPIFAPGTRLLDLRGFVPANFSTGIEILNDNATPLTFVVDVLAKHLEKPRENVSQLVVACHTQGGALIPVEPYELAVKVASAISADAVAAGHPLACRAVDATPRGAAGTR